MIATCYALEVLGEHEVEKHVPELLRLGILNAVHYLLKEPRIGRHLCLPILRQLLPRDGEFDQKGDLERAAGVVALTSATDPVGECCGDRV